MEHGHATISKALAWNLVRTFLTTEQFSLIGFDFGWRVVPGVRNRGAATLVVEREAGVLVQFPSSVPPGRIESGYVGIRHLGHVCERDSRESHRADAPG